MGQDMHQDDRDDVAGAAGAGARVSVSAVSGSSEPVATVSAASVSAPSSGFEGYDVVDVTLGDLMRGERATLGKSLLDVERELRISASYIAAIENGDVGAFSSPGFIAGYVRSYARYIGMDPEWSFRRFCDETGFGGVDGISGQAVRNPSRFAPLANAAPARRPSAPEAPVKVHPDDVLPRARFDFRPKDRFWDRVEPGVLGSFTVLAALVGVIGYGAWVVLYDIQRVQIAPIDEAPVPMAQLDPLAGAAGAGFDAMQGFDIEMPGGDDVARLYRPQALETPVLTPRDEALATLDPDEVGTLGGLQTAPRDETATATAEPSVQVTEPPADDVLIFAVRPTWVRVTSARGITLFEGTLNAGDSYTVAAEEEPPVLQSGNAGSPYFAVNGLTMGPAGTGAIVVRDIALSADAITQAFPMADASADPDLPAVAEQVLDPASR